MKKMMALLATVLFCGLASASPKIGDTVTYAGTYTHEGQTYQLRSTQTITQFNASSNQFLVQSTTELAGSTQTQEEWTNSSDLLSSETVQAVLQNCAQANGVSEQVATAAGAFATCRLTTEEGHLVNVGMVPFGVVKVRTSQADMQVERFSFGQ